MGHQSNLIKTVVRQSLILFSAATTQGKKFLSLQSAFVEVSAVTAVKKPMVLRQINDFASLYKDISCPLANSKNRCGVPESEGLKRSSVG